MLSVVRRIHLGIIGPNPMDKICPFHGFTLMVEVSLADRILNQGTSTATLVSPREFFREALRFGATTALAWHNHPSGDPEPSREDRALTTRLRSAGESLGVPLADHMVLGSDRWHSFRAAEGWDH